MVMLPVLVCVHCPFMVLALCVLLRVYPLSICKYGQLVCICVCVSTSGDGHPCMRVCPLVVMATLACVCVDGYKLV
jgi:hypothetical protein